MNRIFYITVIFLTLTLSMSAIADPEGCRDAVDKYKSAKGDVSDAIRTYATCISASDGHDDCSGAFSTVQSNQDDFESAVSEYESECQ